MSVQEQVLKLVCEQSGFGDDEVSLNSSTDDLDMDSLDSIELVMILEEEFDLAIPDEDCEQWTTVQSIIDYVVNCTLNNLT